KLVFEPARRPDGTPFAARLLYRYAFTLAPKAAPPGARPPGTIGGAAAGEAPAAVNFKGRVVATGGDAPIAGATITVTPEAAPAVTARTGERGEFSFTALAPGKAHVHVAALGYAPFDVDEDVSQTEVTEVVYRLEPAKTGGALEVTVTGEKPPREVTKRTIERSEMERIPGTNGDALRSLENMPGVARPPGLAGLLIVRGSAPQDTQVFIDGTPVPLIYHFGGLSSVVPTEMLDKIDFYPGNYSALYGRAMGGIVDAGLRSPKDDGHYHGLLQADLIDVRAMLEGPVPLLDGWNFVAGGRRSFLDAWFGPVATAAGIGAAQAPVYYDYQFMAEKKFSSHDKLRIAFFGADDGIQLYLPKPTVNEPALSGDAGLHTAFTRLQIRFNHESGDGDRVTVLSAVGRDHFAFGLGPISADLAQDTVTGRFEIAKHLAKGVVLDAGVDMFLGQFDVDLRLPQITKPGEPPNGPISTRQIQEAVLKGPIASPGAYVEAELTPSERLRIVPGVRVDVSSLSTGVYVSPRLSFRYDVRHDYPRTTAKGGVGMYVQPPQPLEATAPVGTDGLAMNRAVEYEGGFEQELTRQLEVSVDGFYKQLDQLVYGAPYAGEANSASGYVVGSEVLLKYKPDKRFFGWLAYTLSRSMRKDAPDQPEHLFQYDQTHILTIIGSYNFGGGWEFGARFRLISGNLVTPNVCDPASVGCDPLRVNALLAAASGSYVAIPYTSSYAERLPLFHALDLRVDKSWRFASWQLSAYLDVENAYNHANVEGIMYNYDYTQRSWVTGLPIIPSFGMRGEF
ncbi:MAG TPA: TonB-dependent receptor, partial [Minicystis sp.]|nr:TonB-dependent receptor [Minicystis sp.]